MNHSEVTNQGTGQWNWEFPAILENVERLCQQSDSVIENCLLQRKDIFAIRLLIREAVNNAVLHGCNQDPALSFSCKLEILSGNAIIEVSDEGPGFDWRARLAQVDSELPEATDECGRGLPIFRRYASSFTLNEAGNCIRLTRIFTKGESNE